MGLKSQTMLKWILLIVMFFPCDVLLNAQEDYKTELSEKEIVVEKAIPITGDDACKWTLTWSNYGLDNSRFVPEYFPILVEIIDSMLSNPHVKFELRGYTDNVGAESYNRTLSRKRADYVKDYFISKGIASERLITIGYGESNPIADNTSSEGRLANNRIEIFVIHEQDKNLVTTTELNNTSITVPQISISNQPVAKNEVEPTGFDSLEADRVNENIHEQAENNFDHKTTTSKNLSANIYNTGEVKLKAPLKQNWSYKTNSIILNQNIVDEICYLNTTEGIVAISLKDGKELWSYSYPGNPIIPSVVTFTNKHAAFLSYEYLKGGEKGKSKLYLIDLENGKEKWVISFEEVWYRPTVLLNEEYFCVVGGIPNEWEEVNNYYEMELDEAFLYCYSINSGAEVWKIRLDDLKTELLAVFNDKVFLGFDYDIKDETPYNKLLCADIQTGEILWDYNPSGLITKSSVGDVILNDNKLYLRPLKGYPGFIAALDPLDGNEIWSNNNSADKLYFRNNKVYAYSANTEWKFSSFSSWYCADIAEGDKIFYKELNQSTDFGKMLATAFLNIGVVAVLVRSADNIAGLVSLFIPSDNSIPSIIPTTTLLNGLSNKSVLNDKGLFGIYRKGDSYVFSIINDKPDDDKKIEYEFPEGITDVSIANGTSPNQAFLTYGGRVVLFNIGNCKEEWSKEFSPGEISLGLIIAGDKLYMFTLQSVSQLVGE